MNPPHRDLVILMSEIVHNFITHSDIACGRLKPSEKNQYITGSKEVRPMGQDNTSSRQLVSLGSDFLL